MHGFFEEVRYFVTESIVVKRILISGRQVFNKLALRSLLTYKPLYLHCCVCCSG